MNEEAVKVLKIGNIFITDFLEKINTSNLDNLSLQTVLQGVLLGMGIMLEEQLKTTLTVNNTLEYLATAAKDANELFAAIQQEEPEEELDDEG